MTQSTEPHEWSNPPSVYVPLPHYSQVARAGQTLYISGQLGLDANGELVGEGDARAQARQAWRNLVGILGHYGATPRHLVKTTTYITHWA
jgi:2-iminobutanoate/2-iminopropanoate deaminase